MQHRHGTTDHALPPPPPPPPTLVSLHPARELDRPVRGQSRRRLALPGGVVLFLAMFLPATRVCGDTVVTGVDLLRFPPFVLPYVLGALAALVVLARDVRALRGQTLWLQVPTALALLAVGALAHVGIFTAANPIPAGLAALGWWVAAAGLWPALTRRPSWEWRAARTLGVVGFVCAAWFGMFLLLDEHVMYGTGVAFVGAVLVGAGGYAWEQELAAERWRLPAIPLARVSKA
jgi:hypothetical protein